MVKRIPYPPLRYFLCRSLGTIGSSAAIALNFLAITGLPGGAAPQPIAQPSGTTAPFLAELRAKQEAAAPTVPPLPNPVPEPIDPDESGIIDLDPAPNDDIGIGQLRPADPTSGSGSSSLMGAGWLRGVALPIYPSPESPPWGWLINGWLVPNNAPPLAIGRDAAFSMVKTGQQIYTFPVLEVRPDGWFRFQYTPAGAAWAHTSQLALGSVPLVIETWDDSMKHAARIEFRRPGLSQPMRLAPTSNAPLQALVGPNSIIQPLDLDGDWLRVRVTQPAQGCTALPGSSTAEGWVRWRSETATPLIWFAPHGC
ncbi:hypothetical protein [Nodosilinea nodulosa]|uniref:hypothetical protein n=1 Tax=Nodosilinea nodulosa TaxID=416001 RepID=UPI0012D82A5D|nr:hypothetical protein [Nodosilinea nodulosa]